MPRTEWSRRVGAVSKTSLILPEKLWKRIKMQAIEEARNAQEIVAEALEDYLKKVKKGGDRR